ncbi:hypothetical protein C9J12_16775 [Photobacterium frigidiphilum]|uniref:Uncharacterized protein n=1 Tax=Photobacterium frigidiphilum TaxID=264736 RepID=A0A2T3JDC5_9GAMM|nr:hypothetical protein C9J12_16775 [Photobacterium frigidiphilum]
MGFILYATDLNLSATSEDALKSALKNFRGVGNFSFMLINILNVQEKGAQLIPVESIGSKDEFEGIKKISSQETIVVHHLLAGMSLSHNTSVTPGNIPKQVMVLEEIAEQFVLPARRERSYPRVLKCSKNRYPVRKNNAAHVK